MEIQQIASKNPKPKIPVEPVYKPDELTESYLKELYVYKIAESMCDDNSRARHLIMERLRAMKTEILAKYAETNGIKI